MSARNYIPAVLAVVMIIGLGVALILPAILAVREAGRIMTCQDNLRVWSLAAQNYADTLNSYPIGTSGNRKLAAADRFGLYLDLWGYFEGKPPMLLLDKTQAWNAEVNRWPQMEHTIDIFEPTQRTEIRPLHFVSLLGCPSASTRETVHGIHVTEYVGMGGLGPKSPEFVLGQDGCGTWGFDRGIRDSDVVDGLSSTITLIETSRDRGPWLAGGRPTVRGVDMDESPFIGRGRQFGGLHPGGCTVVMLDSSARFIDDKVDPSVFAAMVTIAGQDGGLGEQ